MLKFQTVRVGSGGPIPCVRCGGSAEPVSHIPAAEVIERIREAAAHQDPTGFNLILGGTDVFGHRELPALVNAAVREGVARLAVETDGGALAVGGNAGGALHAGVRHVRVTVVDLDRAASGVTAWIEAAAGVEAHVVATAVIPVCVHNVATLSQSVAALAGAGVAGITLDATDVAPSAAVSAHIVAACDTGTVNGVWVDVSGAEGLLPASHLLHRLEEGAAL